MRTQLNDLKAIRSLGIVDRLDRELFPEAFAHERLRLLVWEVDALECKLRNLYVKDK